jgi:uncharacterized protein
VVTEGGLHTGSRETVRPTVTPALALWLTRGAGSVAGPGHRAFRTLSRPISVAASVSCLAIIGFYRRFISPLLPPACRFEPSCSCYAQEAFKSYGFVRGALLTCLRLARCQPLSQPGYDPVPERPEPDEVVEA